jgi:hypothetical protein
MLSDLGRYLLFIGLMHGNGKAKLVSERRRPRTPSTSKKAGRTGCKQVSRRRQWTASRGLSVRRRFHST